jgi:dephospho-CoA kinase
MSVCQRKLLCQDKNGKCSENQPVYQGIAGKSNCFLYVGPIRAFFLPSLPVSAHKPLYIKTEIQFTVIPMNIPLQVGITGGIGTGKSIVSQVFEVLGIPVYEADIRSKWLLQHHEGIKTELIKAFGPQAYAGGQYNRDFLALEAFHNEEKLKVLNSIIHPRVFEDYASWVEAHASSSYLLRESALLFEAGADKTTDVVIVVTAPVELRIQRVLKRDPFRSRAELEAIMRKQLPEEEKQKRAHFVVYNDETRLLLPQVLDIHQQLLAKASGKIKA